MVLESAVAPSIGSAKGDLIFILVLIILWILCQLFYIFTAIAVIWDIRRRMHKLDRTFAKERAAMLEAAAAKHKD